MSQDSLALTHDGYCTMQFIAPRPDGSADYAITLRDGRVARLTIPPRRKEAAVPEPTRDQQLDEAQGLVDKLVKARDKASAKSKKWGRRASDLTKEILVAQAEIDRLRRPAEPTGQSPIVEFTKTFRGKPPVYTYLAFKEPTTGRWFITGDNRPGGRTWEQLVDFARFSNVAPVQFKVIPRLDLPRGIVGGLVSGSSHTVGS